MYIMQDTEFFNFSLDSVLLANYVKITPKIKTIMDIGCGNAPIPLILSTKTNAKIIGVEIQKDIFDLATESIKINNKENQIEIINDDIKNVYANMESDSVDIITCNPPYFKYLENSNVNENVQKTIARHEKMLDLENVFKISKKLLKNNGSIYMVHRPERLIEIIKIMLENNIEPKTIKLVHPQVDKEANILLIRGVKNGKSGLKVESPIISHLDNGDYTDEIRNFFE